MDSIQINTELSKIQNIHSSFDETNPITYVIFQATFQNRLSPAQNEWLENKIQSLNRDIDSKISEFQSQIDVELAKKSILEKSENTGYLKNRPQ